MKVVSESFKERFFELAGFINENVQQAKKFLSQNGISENDPSYIDIRDIILKDMPGYVFLFTKFHFGEGADLTDLNSLANWIRKNKQILNKLRKPVADYGTFSELFDDISLLEKEHLVFGFINNEFPGNLKRELKSMTGDEKIKLIFKMLPIVNASEEFKKQDFLKKISAFKDKESFFSFLDGKRKLLEPSRENLYNETKEKIENSYGAELVYDENNILVAKILTFEASKEIGCSSNWCITRMVTHFNTYTDGGMNTQYFVFDFNKPSDDFFDTIGITIFPDGKVKTAHDRIDKRVNDNVLFELIKGMGIDFKEVFKPISEEEYYNTLLLNLESGKGATVKQFENLSDEYKGQYLYELEMSIESNGLNNSLADSYTELNFNGDKDASGKALKNIVGAKKYYEYLLKSSKGEFSNLRGRGF